MKRKEAELARNYREEARQNASLQVELATIKAAKEAAATTTEDKAVEVANR